MKNNNLYGVLLIFAFMPYSLAAPRAVVQQPGSSIILTWDNSGDERSYNCVVRFNWAYNDFGETKTGTFEQPIGIPANVQGYPWIAIPALGTQLHITDLGGPAINCIPSSPLPAKPAPNTQSPTPHQSSVQNSQTKVEAKPLCKPYTGVKRLKMGEPLTMCDDGSAHISTGHIKPAPPPGAFVRDNTENTLPPPAPPPAFANEQPERNLKPKSNSPLKKQILNCIVPKKLTFTSEGVLRVEYENNCIDICFSAKPYVSVKYEEGEAAETYIGSLVRFKSLGYSTNKSKIELSKNIFPQWLNLTDWTDVKSCME